MPRFTCYYEPMLKLPNYMYGHFSNVWVEDACKVLGPGFNSGPLGPLKGWGTLANYLLANCDQFTACNCETIYIECIFLSMGIVPMHQWKVPLKYQATLLFPSGPLGLGGAADTMVGGGVPTKWREQKSTSTYILKLRRNSAGVPYFITKASSRCHSPPPQLRSLRGFIVTLVVVIVIVIITAVTTILPPPSSVIYLIVVFVLSLCPLPFLIRL